MKKKIGIGIGVAAVVLLIAAAALYINITPKLKLKARLDELIKETYTYSVDCSMEGMDLKILGDKFEGTISGSKGTDILYGNISYNGFQYLDLYVDSDYNMIFNAKPLFESMVETVEEKTGLSLSMVSLLIGDLNISLEQIEQVIGRDILTISDAGISSDVFGELAGNGAGKAAYVLKQVKDTDDIDKLLGDDAMYFSITMDNGTSRMIIGIPKADDEKKMSVQIFYNEAVWNFVGAYEPGEVPDMEMPESTLSDSTIEALREIYACWEELQGD